MAKVTNLKSIANNTPYTMSVRNGENHSEQFSIAAGSAWNGSLWIPWIGKDSENYKAIQLLLGPRGDVTIWLFQDYWEPPNANAIKYLIAPEMKYSGGTQEVDGNNRGGGEKILNVSSGTPSYLLKMI
ncbi:hypothetical protein [Pseudomonas chlororaphis]|uniref:hypothetical protein n=1 Tax=Pseudomonas chlororaphis TaxID=587753 RepID=UPI000F58669C|nr:hypothetical protein [Pseudomonas chlororaphis]